MSFKFSKTLLAALITSTAMLGTAHAADVERYDIKLKATVPSDEFHVRPVDAGWIDQEQTMEFDLGTGKLHPIEKLFQYKNSSGAIMASPDPNMTAADGSALIFSGNKTISLKVSFNNTELTETAKQVVASTDAATGGRTNLRIEPKDSGAMDLEKDFGEYTGTVAVIFEPSV